VYESVKNGTFDAKRSPYDLEYVLKYGYPLPAKHGRLIDYNDVDDMLCDFTEAVDISYRQIMEYVDKVPTIIPADKEVSE
jgi:hypothetical protein